MRNVRILLLLTHVAWASLAYAQSGAESRTSSEHLRVKAGIKGGWNIAALPIGNEVENQQYRSGFHLGVFLKAPLNRFLALQPELTYNNQGTHLLNYRTSRYAAEGTVNLYLNYVTLSLIGVLNLGPFNIHMGPYVAYLTHAHSSPLTPLASGTPVSLSRQDFRSFDYGLTLGTGLDIGRFHPGVRLSGGSQRIGKDLTQAAIDANPVNASRNFLLQVYLGIHY
jgi:hypothetical protein